MNNPVPAEGFDAVLAEALGAHVEHEKERLSSLAEAERHLRALARVLHDVADHGPLVATENVADYLIDVYYGQAAEPGAYVRAEARLTPAHLESTAARRRFRPTCDVWRRNP